ncbi:MULTISPECIES: hypothetical protein [Hyphomonas]|nr:hypothetical protein [Hyphomonas sp.]
MDPLPDPKAVSLDEAISLLEAGKGEGLLVDLGHGRTATADGHRGEEGLLQRLRGHRMMMSLASGGADLSRFAGMGDAVIVAPLVQEILDAADQKD